MHGRLLLLLQVITTRQLLLLLKLHKYSGFACVCVWMHDWLTNIWKLRRKCSSFFHIYLLSNTKCHFLFRVSFVQQYTISIFTCNFCSQRCFCYCYCCCFSVGDWISFVYSRVYMHACTLKYVFHLVPLSFPLVVLDWLYFDTVNSICLLVSSLFFVKCLTQVFFHCILIHPKWYSQNENKKAITSICRFLFSFKNAKSLFSLFVSLGLRWKCFALFVEHNGNQENSQFQNALFDREM